MIMEYQIRVCLDVPNHVYAKTFATKEERDEAYDEYVRHIFDGNNKTFYFKQDIPPNTSIQDAGITILCSRVIVVECTDWKKSG